MREREQQVSKGPLFAPRSHFIFLTRNNTQNNGFLLPSLLLFLTPGQPWPSYQGKEAAPRAAPAPLRATPGLSRTTQT